MVGEDFKVKISVPEPQTHFIKDVPKTTVTDKDGNKTVLGWRTLIGKLHTRIMTVEARGYASDGELPVMVGDSKTLTANETDDDGNIVSTDSFDEKTVVFEASRINEANMWRVTKTVTIRALYTNGNYVAGKTDFDAGDEAI